MSVADNIKRVKEEIITTCYNYNRNPNTVKLLAVSKTVSLDTINEAYIAGQTAFGESRVQEFLTKYQTHPEFTWHFIGHLQTNKINKIIKTDVLLHSVDSLALALKLNQRLLEQNKSLKVLLQVNIDEDPAKFGFSKAGLWQNIEKILELKGLNVCGLMTISALKQNPEEARGSFAKLRILQENLIEKTKHNFPELSMGMSSDYKEAIAEGATIVRVGTAIFGER